MLVFFKNAVEKRAKGMSKKSIIMKNLQKLLNVQKSKVEQLEIELSEIKHSKACLEEDFFHAIKQLQSISLKPK